MTAPQGAFRDPTRPPRPDELGLALGLRRELWERLERWLEATYGATPEPLFYGSDTGWVTRYRRAGKRLVTLMPMPDALRVVLVIGPSIADRIPELSLQAATHYAFESARAYPDGRCLTLPVETTADIDDITTLIAAKSPPPRRRPTRKDQP
jgi:hypothetical protein